jgi:hypothetical protein
MTKNTTLMKLSQILFGLVSKGRGIWGGFKRVYKAGETKGES